MKSMIRLSSALIVISTVPSAFAESFLSKFSVELSAGAAYSDSQEDSVERALRDRNEENIVVREDRRDTALRLALAYRISSNFSVSAGVMDLGDASTQVSGDAVDPEVVRSAVIQNAAIAPSGGFVELAYQLPISNSFSAELTGGWFSWSADVGVLDEGSVERDGGDAYGGLGLLYHDDDNFRFGLSYYRLNYGDQHSDLLMLRMIADLSE